MKEKLFGVPLGIWGIVCLLLTVIWIFVWPDARTVQGSVAFFILRWFHALTWLLLSVAAFLSGFQVLGGTRTAKPVALLSLLVYIVFMIVFLTSKPL